MSHALLTLTQGKQALTEAEIMILAEMADDNAAYDMQPARVKIAPGGSGQFLMNEESAKNFTAIVAISQKIRGYWPGSGTGSPPLCSSPDGAHGYFADRPDQRQIEDAMKAKRPHPGVQLFIAQDAVWPDSYSCIVCDLAQWGSEYQRRGGAGKGQACKSMRRLLLLIDGWALPALMSLPPTSIRVWDAYCSSLAARRGAYFAVRTLFELDTAQSLSGDKYNVVRVSVAGRVSDADLPAVSEIRRQYRELVGGLPVQSDEYEIVETVEPEPDKVPF